VNSRYLDNPYLSQLVRVFRLLCCSKGHELSGHNGFIPLLTYGDILLTAEVDGVSSEITVESPASPTAEVAPRPGSADKLETKHVFARTHLQSSTQCQFCGKKVGIYNILIV